MQFDFRLFYWYMIRAGRWPVGSAWFLFALLVLDAIAALVWAAAPQTIEALGQTVDQLRERPMSAFAVFLAFSIVVYLPLHLIFGDSDWLTAGRYHRDPDQPHPALWRLLSLRRCHRRGRLAAGVFRGGRGARWVLAHLAWAGAGLLCSDHLSRLRTGPV